VIPDAVGRFDPVGYRCARRRLYPAESAPVRRAHFAEVQRSGGGRRRSDASANGCCRTADGQTGAGLETVVGLPQTGTGGCEERCELDERCRGYEYEPRLGICTLKTDPAAFDGVFRANRTVFDPRECRCVQRLGARGDTRAETQVCAPPDGDGSGDGSRADALGDDATEPGAQQQCRLFAPATAYMTKACPCCEPSFMGTVAFLVGPLAGKTQAEFLCAGAGVSGLADNTAWAAEPSFCGDERCNPPFASDMILVRLEVTGASVPVLVRSSFARHPFLQRIVFRGNGMEDVEDGAFAGLRALRDLQLNANNLAAVPSELPRSLRFLSGNFDIIHGPRLAWFAAPPPARAAWHPLLRAIADWMLDGESYLVL